MTTSLQSVEKALIVEAPAGRWVRPVPSRSLVRASSGENVPSRPSVSSVAVNSVG